MSSLEYTNSFNVYPNPSSSILNISSPKQTRFSIVSSDGEEIFTETISSIITIDVSKLANGSYFVKDHETGETITFIKE